MLLDLKNPNKILQDPKVIKFFFVDPEAVPKINFDSLPKALLHRLTVVRETMLKFQGKKKSPFPRF
jgi:hypothetical protein